MLIPEPIGPLPLASIQPLDGTELACDPLTAGSLDGQIALVRRGICFFQDKADNVFAAGATAMVVYNNVEGISIVMSFDDERGPGGPAVMINRDSGEQLRDLALQDGDVSVILRAEEDLAAFPSQADIVSGFSSRGPNIDGSIKPDLTAVGSGIYSASNSGSEFILNSNGTSFSTPLVAGAAALVLQLHQDWTPQAVKSSLVTTADKSPSWEGESAGVFLTGNGRLDLEQVLRVSAMVDPVSISFGRIEAESTEAISLAREFLLQNLTNEKRTFDLGYSLTHVNSSAHITLTPASVELDPFESIEVEVRLDGIRPLLEGAFEGHLEIVDGTSSYQLSMAFHGLVVVTGYSDILEVSQSEPAPFQDVTSAVASARPGDVIEITDSSAYQESLLVHVNNHGTPLDNLTLRNRPGESPVIEGTPGDSSVILVQDVENITIEGLEIRGAQGGISLENSSGVIHDNKILSSTSGSEDTGIELKDSLAHIRGNELAWDSGSGILASGSEALVQDNLIAPLPTETPGTTTGISADSDSSIAIFGNSIRQIETNENNGYGIQILNSSALIKSNRISAWGGEVGSGVFAVGDPSLISLQDNLLSDNSRRGLHLMSGAEAQLLRDRIDSNRGAGLLIEKGSRLTANSVLVTNNSSGLAASESSLTLFNSVFAHSEGDGLFAAGCALVVGNCTVFGNGGLGLLAVSPASGHHVANSVFSGNLNGSLSGLESTVITHNLIGDGQFQGLNGNIGGEAVLTNPEESSFAPLPNSPAVDAGDNSFVTTNGDLFSHHRIKDGDSDGSAIVDLGAIEFGSVFSPPIILPLLTVETDQWLGFAISNAYQPVSEGSSQEEELPDNSTVRFHLRNNDGSAVDQKDLTVPKGTQNDGPSVRGVSEPAERLAWPRSFRAGRSWLRSNGQLANQYPGWGSLSLYPGSSAGISRSEE